MREPYTVTHIVRRFGPVGGMENFVWRLVHQLLENGVRCWVICETADPVADPRIQIVTVEPAIPRPRWRAMRHFQQRVETVLDARREQFGIVHSHERCLSHQVTTFHGPPMGHLRHAPWYRRWSRRVRAWLDMEIEELVARHVQVVCPVSGGIRSSLEALYPALQDRSVVVTWPGVDQPMYRRFERKKRLLFVGKEWKRKGLDRAVEIIQALRATDSGYTLTVMGVDPTEVPSRWRRLDGVIWVGWKPSVPYADYDILLHPARQEPFGMVVLEARAAGLGCVISDTVGASECDLQDISILAGDAAMSEWVRATQALIDQPISYQVSQSWDDVATQYIQQVYALVQVNITDT